MHRTYRHISLGRRLRSAECGAGVQLIEAQYAPDTRFAPHAHAGANVSLVLCGELEETVGTDRLCATSYSVVVKPAGTVHANRFGPQGARTLAIEFSARELDELNDGAGGASLRAGLGRWQWFRGGEVAAAAVRLYRAFVEQPQAPWDVESRVIELLASVQEQSEVATPRGNATPHAWLDEARDYLNDCFADHVRVRDVARSVGVHPVYLARAFRVRFGCGVSEYLQRLRLHHAAHRLASGDAPVALIAADAGFADQSHLTRALSRATGLPPAHFRRLIRHAPP